jgi:hypothetical protein
MLNEGHARSEDGVRGEAGPPGIGIIYLAFYGK